MVESGHRAVAWHILLERVAPAARKPVVVAMREAQRLWHAYRDEVAAACGCVDRSS
jgi:hypothetical protein